MLKTLSLAAALAAGFTLAAGSPADANMRRSNSFKPVTTSGFVGTQSVRSQLARCEDLRDQASRIDQRGTNYYFNQFIQCINR